MLIRDKLRYKANADDWAYAVFHLANNNNTFYCERHDGKGFTAWEIPGHLTQRYCEAFIKGERLLYDEVDEFQAQAVFDHYVQTIGLKNKTKESVA